MTDWAHLARRVRRRGRRELEALLDRASAARAARAEQAGLLAALQQARGPQASRLQERLRALLLALGVDAGHAGLPALVAHLETRLARADDREVWLALAVLTGRLPLDEDVVETRRRLRLDGPGAALAPWVVRTTALTSRDRRHPARVEVLTGAVTLDLHHTSRTALATGIQRVARQTARRWDRDHDVVVVGWTEDGTALRRLGDAERGRALGQPATGAPAPAAGDDATLAGDPRTPPAPPSAPTVVVPWQGTHVTLELATEEPRTARMLALARHSGNRTGAIGFDCVPLTTAETTGEAMGGAFAKTLAAVRHTDRVATISEGAAVEYRGWRRMLTGAGLAGPDVVAVPLPVEASTPSGAALAAARSRFTVGSAPMVLVVGSHEPRKNHLAVLHAAELLWREGTVFSLVMVGGNAWRSERTTQVLAGLRGAGRPIDAVRALDDDALWAVYRLAHVVLFPSLNEGFGLPVAEALASGTPAVTSGHGSTAEIAAEGGALLVDPRDDRAVADALRRVLVEPGLRDRLAAEAAARPRRSWDTYADELWRELVAPGPAGPAPAAPAAGEPA